jgi:hypothetical protein
MEIVNANWRKTAAGGITYPLGIRFKEGTIEIVPPLRRLISRGGTHGIYIFSEVDAILYLEASNRGHRTTKIRMIRAIGNGERVKRLQEIADDLWQLSGNLVTVVTGLRAMATHI